MSVNINCNDNEILNETNKIKSEYMKIGSSSRLIDEIRPLKWLKEIAPLVQHRSSLGKRSVSHQYITNQEDFPRQNEVNALRYYVYPCTLNCIHHPASWEIYIEW